MDISTTFEFLQTSGNCNVPLFLQSRNEQIMWLAIFGISLSFILIAGSRVSNSNYISVFTKVLLKNRNVEKIIKEEFELISIGSFFLIVNFLVSTSFLVYLSAYFYLDSLENYYLFLYPILPLYFFFWPLISLSISGFIFKEGPSLKENKKNVILFAQILGILNSILLLIWVFNLQLAPYFSISFIAILLFFYVYRIFRGILFSFQNGIHSYYIILYFCTLEILPIVFLYHTFSKNIQSLWLVV